MTGINFKGKALVVNHHLAVPFCELVPNKKASVLVKGTNVSLHDNLILHGDNLLALKALIPTHAGKINCVYIDPPYNTGKEGWCYNDKVANPMMTEWLGKVVDKEDMTRHDKWLCMMYPRLSLLHELLAEDGVIFISIDDNEVHRLRMLMDEIFGDDNSVATLVWENKEGGGSGDSKHFKIKHEYILVYAKAKEKLCINRVAIEDSARYTLEDEHVKERGKYQLVKLDSASIQQSARLVFPIKGPDNKNIMPNGCWRWSTQKVEWGIKEDFIAFRKQRNGNWAVYSKQYLKVDHSGIPWERDKLPIGVISQFSTTQSSNNMKEIFSGAAVFKYSKPYQLIKLLLGFATKNNSDAIILDSFAGSGTTAHAVLELNKEYGGDRKFVLVECEEYANTITAERVRRVIKNMSDTKKPTLTEKLIGGFSYWELGSPIETESMLGRKVLPSYEDLARYVFYTATGEEWNSKKMRKSRHYIGDSRLYEVYLLYKPNGDFLMNSALTLDMVQKLPHAAAGKTRIFFAAVRHVDEDILRILNIKYCQLPFEIYKMKETK